MTERERTCYLWVDVDIGVKCFIVVFGQQLVKQQVELLSELAGVCSQSSELSGATGKRLLGVRRRGELPTIGTHGCERSHLCLGHWGIRRCTSTPKNRCWQPGLRRHVCTPGSVSLLYFFFSPRVRFVCAPCWLVRQHGLSVTSKLWPYTTLHVTHSDIWKHFISTGFFIIYYFFIICFISFFLVKLFSYKGEDVLWY